MIDMLQKCFDRALRTIPPASCKAALAIATMLLPIAEISPAAAQMTGQPFSNPPKLQSRQGSGKQMTLQTQPLNTPVMSGRRQLDLSIVYTKGSIPNPTTNRLDSVNLRSYSGEGVSPGAPFVAPLVEVAPGERVTITLHNKLPADPSCTAPNLPLNTPHCFNGTNLHAHGLWVSPSGNSDNVLLSINPGVSFQYEYDIPPDHPSGTFWYHSHRHGSTAMQVSSGMAGALIVRGRRLPTATTTGDIDTLLYNANGSAMDENILVLQQIQYACLDSSGAIKVEKNSNGRVIAWVCDPNDVGGIEFYDDPGNNGLFGPPYWRQSGRFTTINGIMMPRFAARAGQVQRWRLIHGGVRDTITLSFRRRIAGAPGPVALRAADAEAYIQQNCTGPQLTYHLIASDGLTMAAARPVTQTTLQPGYRNDALVLFPEAGDYCVVNESAPAAGSVGQQAPSRQFLGHVAVAAGVRVDDPGRHLTDALVAAARRVIPAPLRDRIVKELRNGLSLESFTPHPEIKPGDVTGYQELAFYIDLKSAGPARFAVSSKLIDPKNFNPTAFKPYDPDDPKLVRVLKLTGVDEWKLQSGFVSHPFHIHINPFQIVEILDPSGKDVSVAGSVDNAGGQVDPQYPGLQGVWKDTLWIKNLISNPDDIPDQLSKSIYTIKIRTRYQRYVGEFVLHCHILDHEDQGMMQKVRIELPDGAGGVTRSHH